MPNRPEEKNEINNKNLVDKVISIDDVDILITLFDDLKRKVINNLAAFNDLELLAQKIIDLSYAASKEQVDSVVHGIQELSKQYTVLLPFLIKMHKEAKQCQIEYADHDNLREQVENSKVFTSCLQVMLIKPMILKTADTTQNCVVSKYFGKIPVISLSDTVNYTIPELYDIDSYLEKNMNMISEIGVVESSLQPYALYFGYLNSANLTSPIMLGNIAPGLMFVDPDVLRMFLPCNDDGALHTRGLTNQVTKTIFISIDRSNPITQIPKTTIHEMQHLYNSVFFSNERNTEGSNELSDAAIDAFIKLTNQLEDQLSENFVIVEEIRYVLNCMKNYPQKNRHLDELSAQLTLLLFTYPHTLIRESIDIISLAFDGMSQDDANNNGLAVCNAVSNAFYNIEYTIDQLSTSLSNDKADISDEVSSPRESKTNNTKSLSSTSTISYLPVQSAAPTSAKDEFKRVSETNPTEQSHSQCAMQVASSTLNLAKNRNTLWYVPSKTVVLTACVGVAALVAGALYVKK